MVGSGTKRWYLVALLVAALLATACGTGQRPTFVDGEAAGAVDNGSAGPTTVEPAELPEVAILGAPGGGAVGVALGTPIIVRAVDGTLGAVAVNAVETDQVEPPTGPNGEPMASVPFEAQSLPGVLSKDHIVWLAGGEALRPLTTYEVTASATGAGHRATSKSWQFTTAGPATELHTAINVFDGRNYGVGMPVVVNLNAPIDPSLRPEVEKRITMTTTPAVDGAWRWFGDSSLHWRPAQYWPAGTKATIDVDLAGFRAGNGVWGVDGRSVNFAIGDSRVSTVDAANHQMTVVHNGAVARNIPVSTGRDEFPTKSGVHVIMTHEESHTMDSSTIGIPTGGPGGYRETVKWAERISNSGEFVHSAPWSTGDQGNSNVSHGCINISDSDGHWFFDQAQIGDIVLVVNTPATLAPDNGYGDWQIPWSDWAD